MRGLPITVWRLTAAYILLMAGTPMNVNALVSVATMERLTPHQEMLRLPRK